MADPAVRQIWMDLGALIADCKDVRARRDGRTGNASLPSPSEAASETDRGLDLSV